MKLTDIFLQLFIMNVQKNLPLLWARSHIIKNLVQTTHGLQVSHCGLEYILTQPAKSYLNKIKFCIFDNWQ
jgi:hypothetical protein